MVPDRLAFISYKAIWNLRVCMGNNSFAPVLGRGIAIILLNGQRILIHHVLHVPAHWVPLYSLRAHLHQRGSGFVGSHDTGMHVYFLGLVLSVDTSTDCHLTNKPLGKSVPFPPSTMSNLPVLPSLTRMRALCFALRRFLLPLCWSKMMMGRSCWTQSPHGWAFHLRSSHHLSSPLSPSPSGAWFSSPPLFWPSTLHQSLNTSSFCWIICLGWLILTLLY